MDPAGFIGLVAVSIGWVIFIAMWRKMQETSEFEHRMIQIAERSEYRWQDRVELDPVKVEQAHDEIVRKYEEQFLEEEWRRLGAGGDGGKETQTVPGSDEGADGPGDGVPTGGGLAGSARAAEGNQPSGVREPGW